MIAHVSLWKNNERFREFIPGELALLGKIAGTMLIAGLKDQSAEVQINSVLGIGVLLGGRADFKALAFKPANPEFQNMFSISRTVLEKFSRQFVLLSPEVNNDQLKALSDKVHDMIE